MAEEAGLKVTILRFFNAYGARNHPSWWGGPLSVFFEDLLDGRRWSSTATAARSARSPT